MKENLLEKLINNRKEAYNMGDSSDFELIFNVYYAPLVFYAQKYIGESEAEDQISNLFFKLWTKKQVFNNVNHIQAFLYTASKNACLDYLKVSNRSQSRDFSFYEELNKIENSFFNDFIKTEVWAEIYREINQLPSQCSKVIKLSYIDGLSNEEAATTLGISLQTVKNHKYKGLKILREKLSDANYLFFIASLSTPSLF